jgi:hypothetical protein
MTSEAEAEANFRRLGLSILMLEEKLEEIKTYSQEMAKDKSKFDPYVLINISNRLVSAAYELNQSYENHKRDKPTH